MKFLRQGGGYLPDQPLSAAYFRVLKRTESALTSAIVCYSLKPLRTRAILRNFLYAKKGTESALTSAIVCYSLNPLHTRAILRNFLYVKKGTESALTSAIVCYSLKPLRTRAVLRNFLYVSSMSLWNSALACSSLLKRKKSEYGHLQGCPNSLFFVNRAVVLRINPISSSPGRNAPPPSSSSRAWYPDRRSGCC